MIKKLKKGIAVAMAVLMLLEPSYRAAAVSDALPSETAEQTVTEESVTEESIAEETVMEEVSEPEQDVVFAAEGYTVHQYITGIWEGGYNATLEIQNTGDKEIRNWYLVFDNQFEFENISNAVVISNEEGVCTLKNAGWNANIKPGESISVFYTIRENFQGFAQSYKIVGDHAQAQNEDYDVTFLLDNVWDGGFTGSISIHNLTDETMEDWTIEFDYENDFTSVWNGVINSVEDHHYVISNADYNACIGAGETVTIGFLVNGGNAQATIENVKVTKHVLESIEVQHPGSDEVPQDEDNYVQDYTEDDIAYDEFGLTYVKNELIVMTYLGTDKRIVESIAAEMGAQIVGYIKDMGMFQLEFTEDKTCEELEEYIDLFYVYPFVMYVDLNYISAESVADYNSNDAIYNDGKTCQTSSTDSNGNGVIDYGEKTTTLTTPGDAWNVSNPKGDNWGLEAINAPGAWDFLGSFPDADKVKVGVIDNMFGYNPDLTVQFANLYNNPATIDNDHGTHVSGTIGACFDNNLGISGVATNVTLYGYSINGMDTTAKRTQMFKQLIINNGVKVINISYGYTDDLVYSATRAAANGDTSDKALKAVEKETKGMVSAFRQILMGGYDFLICQAAGNSNDGKYIKNPDPNSGYAYVKYDSKVHGPHVTTENQGADARYNFWDTNISDESVSSHIMIVGSVGYSSSKYTISGFSNPGTVVDVYAPGENILSTVNMLDATPYQTMGGTSMATPHITGLAALLWQANPNLSSGQVKQLIMTSQGHPVLDSAGNQLTAGDKTYYVPDAAQCVDVALNHFGVIWTHSELPSGYLKGSVASDATSSPLANIDIMIVRTSTGQSNLDNYWFSTTTDENGEFNILLPQGTYEVIVSDPYWNYVPFSIKNVVITPDNTKELEKIYLYTSDIYFICSNGQVLGTVYNALNGSVIANAEIVLRSGWNNVDGVSALDVYYFGEQKFTDAQGNFDVTLPLGQYTLEISKEGYIVGYYNVFCGYDENPSRMYYVLNPVMKEGEYRIVLTWKATPRDLDSHLLYYADGATDPSMHVYYSNSTGRINGVTVAALDLDDTSGYGPETVTLTVNAGMLTGTAKFKYCVHDFTNRSNGSTSKELSYSGAVVQVYYGNAVIESYHVRENVIANLWEVFEINCDGLKTLNYYKNESSPGNIR